MITLEKIETMRARTDASFREAKAALEATDGDLEAAILLYNKKKAQSSSSGANTAQSHERADNTSRQEQKQWNSAHNSSYQASHEHSDSKTRSSSAHESPPDGQHQKEQKEQRYRPHYGEDRNHEAHSFFHSLWGLLIELFHRSITTHFSVYKQGGRFFSIPLLAFIIVFLASFWLMPIVLIIGLCAGFSYHIEHV